MDSARDARFAAATFSQVLSDVIADASQRKGSIARNERGEVNIVISRIGEERVTHFYYFFILVDFPQPSTSRSVPMPIPHFWITFAAVNDGLLKLYAYHNPASQVVM